MATDVPDLLQSATTAVTAARDKLDEIEQSRVAAFDEQIAAATRLSRSGQLSAELSSAAADALRYQRDQASGMRTAVTERRDVLDKANADIASLVQAIGEGPG